MTVSKIRLPDNTEHDIRAKYLESTPPSEVKSVEFITRTTTEDATVATIQKIYGNAATVNNNLVPLTANTIMAKDVSNNVVGRVTLNLTSLTGKLNGTGSSVIIFPDGMKKGTEKYDEMIGGTAKKRFKMFDAGSVSWTYQSNNTRFYTTSAISGALADGDVALSGYTKVKDSTNMSFFMGSNRRVYLYNTSMGSDATALQTSLSGKYLIYEIPEEEYTLDESLQTQYQVVTGGTESIVPSDSSLSAPIKMDVIYGNAADTILNLPANYISVDSMKDFLSALGTQMNGTWSMQYADGKYTFTFTSS